MSLLYIHGFASTGVSGKVSTLREMLVDVPVVSPTLSHRPRQDLALLNELIESRAVTTVVGSSLGGFYALALAQRHRVRLILVNPSLRPYESSTRKPGVFTIHGTDQTFVWREEQLAELADIGKTVEAALEPTNSRVAWANTLVLLAAKDEVLDASASAARLPLARVMVDPDADHRFSDIARYADAIREVVSSRLDQPT